MNAILRNLGFILKTRQGEGKKGVTSEGEGEVGEGTVVWGFWEVLSAGDCREQVEGESQTQERPVRTQG